MQIECDIDKFAKTTKNDTSIPRWIYIGDDKERYVLGQPGRRNILIVGSNPSTATPGENNLDRTIRRVRKMASMQGYDGWIMVNLYPLRNIKSNMLPSEADRELLKNNLNVIEAVAKYYEIENIWAAWGNIIGDRPYLVEMLEDIIRIVDCKKWLYRTALTRLGNPRQPLYMRNEGGFTSFDITNYLVKYEGY